MDHQQISSSQAIKNTICTLGWNQELARSLFDCQLYSENDTAIIHIFLATAKTILTLPNAVKIIQPSSMQELAKKNICIPSDELVKCIEKSGRTLSLIIDSDRFLSKLPYPLARKYCLYLASHLINSLNQLQPSMLVAGFDNATAPISLGICKHLNIEWRALSFTTIPKGYCALAMDLTPNLISKCTLNTAPSDLKFYTDLILELRKGSFVAPAYQSPRTFKDLISSLPAKIKISLKLILRHSSGCWSPFTDSSIGYLLCQYIRRRINMITTFFYFNIKNKEVCDKYAFYGLQMSPESTIDTFAPVYRDQLQVIKKISQSLPQEIKLLVKLHKSDADNYSLTDLLLMDSIPNVSLISPFSSSRDFIRKAAINFSIMGTIGIESALMGKPTIVFGDSPYIVFPSVHRSIGFDGLFDAIKLALCQPEPSLNEIAFAFREYLSKHNRCIYNDWTQQVRIDDAKKLRDIILSDQVFAGLR